VFAWGAGALQGGHPLPKAVLNSFGTGRRIWVLSRRPASIRKGTAKSGPELIAVRADDEGLLIYHISCPLFDAARNEE
jgi:hypothetical protein